jgi:hypothetical protein
VFIVGPKLQSLRREQTPMGICKAAGIDYSGFRKSKKKDKVQHALNRAIQVAKMPGHPNRGGIGDALAPATLKWIWAYADAATLRRCLARAGLLSPIYFRELRKAERIGAGEDLSDYLTNTKHWQGGDARLIGLITPRLFVPSEIMLKFRRVASKAMAKDRVGRLTRLPGFGEWFQRNAMPRTTHGPMQFASQERNGHHAGGSEQVTAVSQVAATVGQGNTQQKKRRGRRAGVTLDGCDALRERVLKDHDAHKYPTVTMLAKAHHISRSRASQIIHGLA